ncbi:hypothetical protein [Leptospira sarikeiensis]|uniref:Uncharacterized protein n=1 Tax=Leptospira sarikeiensis TaxID=2484943 RepID=A0A4R9K297_9LEPT|nr:hypothetical protein [Leptospira sarikeiensis]TGL59246.1 hypothetical protein EHQ64_16305 [Leptospira sarikeiensis]
MRSIFKFWPWIFAGAILISCLVFILWPGKNPESPSISEEASEVAGRKYGLETIEFPDAPHPFEEDPDLEGHAKKLWPSAFQRKKSPEEKEKIREEWVEFALKYPRNIYIPREFRAPTTSQDEKKLLEQLDKFTSADTKFALAKNSGKYSQPGTVPNRPNEPSVNPEEQKAYFSYKISELESRIQLVQYAIQQGRMDASQIPQANSDISSWQKELQQLRQVSESVP